MAIAKSKRINATSPQLNLAMLGVRFAENWLRWRRKTGRILDPKNGLRF
mgnify:CR=1 FL=1